MTMEKKLTILLTKELEYLEDLLKWSSKKTIAIMEDRLEEINKLVKKEEILVNNIALLEEKRIEIIQAGGFEKETPISYLVEKFNGGKLEEIGSKMAGLMEEIRIVNERNQQLVEQNLEWIDFNMNLITSSTEVPSSYGKDKDGREVKNSKIFDRKV